MAQAHVHFRFIQTKQKWFQKAVVGACTPKLLKYIIFHKQSYLQSTQNNPAGKLHITHLKAATSGGKSSGMSSCMPEREFLHKILKRRNNTFSDIWVIQLQKGKVICRKNEQRHSKREASYCKELVSHYLYTLGEKLYCQFTKEIASKPLYFKLKWKLCCFHSLNFCFFLKALS